MQIHYFQIKQLIAISVDSLISSLHSFDIHIKFITFNSSNKVEFWHWVFESLLIYQSSYKLDVLENMCVEKNTLKLPQKTMLQLL